MKSTSGLMSRNGDLIAGILSDLEMFSLLYLSKIALSALKSKRSDIECKKVEKPILSQLQNKRMLVWHAPSGTDARKGCSKQNEYYPEPVPFGDSKFTPTEFLQASSLPILPR